MGRNTRRKQCLIQYQTQKSKCNLNSNSKSEHSPFPPLPCARKQWDLCTGQQPWEDSWSTGCKQSQAFKTHWQSVLLLITQATLFPNIVIQGLVFYLNRKKKKENCSFLVRFSLYWAYTDQQMSLYFHRSQMKFETQRCQFNFVRSTNWVQDRLVNSWVGIHLAALSIAEVVSTQRAIIRLRILNGETDF